MKRLVLFIALCISTTNLFADGRVFCEIREYHTIGKATKVAIDFGQEQSGLHAQVLADDNGEAILFNSPIEALNYMESLGWTFIQAYFTEIDSISTVRWLMCKDVVEGTDPYEGLQVKKALL
ncbi:MAG: hypothetical protein J6V26_05345 [Alistipes sp.]|nr:hypothetical protein [Alistipes sp.]